jgi:hypothetical protein
MAMKEFHSAIAIRSTPQKVWEILTDGAAYPSWNETVTKLEGRIALGEKLAVFPRIDPKRSFPVRVAELEPEKRMVWRGGMPLGFLFKGERTYTLTPKADGSVEFDMREVFSGWLSPLIEKSLPDMQPEFDAFAKCLKLRAEG